MKKSERYDWIESYLKKSKFEGDDYWKVDVLHSKFVDAYIEATGAQYDPMFYGAFKCQQLGRGLSGMFAVGRLTRERVGISGLAGQGFPKWVWIYKLPGRL